MCGGEGVGPEQPWEGVGVGTGLKATLYSLMQLIKKKKSTAKHPARENLEDNMM